MDEFVPRRLFEVLASVYSKANRDVDGMVTLVQGLARTMSSRASESSDLHAASECIATCAASLLPHIDQGLVKRFTITASQDVISRDTEVWREILSLVQGNNLALLDRAYPFAELYYLPMRLTKILGWLGFSIIAGSLFTELNDGNDVVRLSVAKELLERYRDAFVSVSDEQAPYLYVFLNACLLKNQQAMAEEIVTLHFASFCEKKGNVNRAGSDGVRAFEYVLSLGPTEFRPQDWRPANPSHLLPVLLLYGSKLGLDSAWDLKAIDRLFGNFFIPTDYRRFADKVIEHGVNHTQHIGFGVWSLKDFKKEFERAFASTSAHSIDTFPREGILLSMMSSLLFPDRLPLLLERTP